MIASTESSLSMTAQSIAAEKIGIAASHAYITKENTNAQNTQVTSNNVTTTDNNATDAQTTSKANASRSQATAKANASRSQATGNANADYSRDTTEENAKASLENARLGYERSLSQAALNAPNAHGAYTGTSVHEIWENRGVHLRAVTQPVGAIKQAGDTFMRYGYTLGTSWTMGEWVPDGHAYCYWQSTDLWQSVADVDNTQAERMLEAILAAGVTVWDVPEHVGRFDLA